MSRRPRILLLHPPASAQRAYQLDGYCSQPQKGPFRWHPLEFCVFSGRWRGEAQLHLRDLGLDPGAVDLDGLRGYDAVVGLVGAYGWETHRAFWTSATAAGAKVFLSGDLARHEPRYVLDAIPGLAGILPELSTPPSAGALLAGEGVWRSGDATFAIPQPKAPLTLGVQDFSLWDHHLYRLPFTGRHPFASVMTQVGCPHRCDYCILSSYAVAYRDLDELSAEVDAVRRGGARHLYIRDATLNSSHRHLEGVCERLARAGLPWNAFARADGIGRHAPMLAEAGCRVLMLGIDSPSPDALRAHLKMGQTGLEGEIAALERAGIQSVGHFVLGLEEDRSSARDIVRFARALGLHWLTVTPLMIRPGTSMWPGPHALGEDADRREGRAHAAEIAGAMRSFYLRPGPLARVARALGGQPSLALRAAKNLIPTGRLPIPSPQS